MNTSSKISGLLLVSCSLLLAPLVFAQGVLTPPGPPAPTMKTLDQIDAKLEKRTPISSLPFNITQRGSYYLTGNLTGVSGQNGITVSASDVTIDLNGFALLGVAGSNAGIAAQGAQRNLAVRDGIIRNWGSQGITASLCSNNQFERLRLSDNGSAGLSAGTGATVRDCVAENNSNAGITAGDGSSVTNCTAKGNGELGISASTVTDCDAFENGGAGVVATTVIGCTAKDNETSGIVAKFVTSSSAHNNGNYGIDALLGSVTNCRASLNSNDGISSGTVIGCTAIQNDRHGIRVSGTARDNQCTGNGTNGDGAGIYFSNDNVRIEGNNCTDNDWGIQSDAGANGFIVRNSCRGNSEPPTNAAPATSNYDFDRATNTYGPVITVNGDMSANPATSHPGANIQY